MSLASKSDLFAGRFRPSGNSWTHSYISSHRSLPRHPQVREHEQDEELSRVLGQATVAHLVVTKLALDNPKRAFHLGTDTGFELFDSIQYRTHRTLFIQCPTVTRSHCNLPGGVDVPDFLALGYALIAGICISMTFIPMYEWVRLGYIVDVDSGAHYRVYQSRVGVSANMRLHSMVPLIALFRLMHFLITLARAVPGRTGCGHDGGITRCAALQHQAFDSVHILRGLKEFLDQIVTLRQVAKAQDADPGRQAISVSQASKGLVQRRIKQCFFHGEVTQTEQLSQQMKTLHSLMCKWRAFGGLGRCHRRKLRYKLTPEHNDFHEFKQFHLARTTGAQVRSMACWIILGLSRQLLVLLMYRGSFEHFP